MSGLAQREGSLSVSHHVNGVYRSRTPWIELLLYCRTGLKYKTLPLRAVSTRMQPNELIAHTQTKINSLWIQLLIKTFSNFTCAWTSNSIARLPVKHLIFLFWPKHWWIWKKDKRNKAEMKECKKTTGHLSPLPCTCPFSAPSIHKWKEVLDDLFPQVKSEKKGILLLNVQLQMWSLWSCVL